MKNSKIKSLPAQTQLQKNPLSQETALPPSNSQTGPGTLTGSPDVAKTGSVISPESIANSEARIAESGDRPKRKYTKRGSTPAPVEATQVPVSLDEAKMLLNIPFNALAEATEFDGFKLPEEKLNDCAPLMDKVLKQYMPQMEGPHAALTALCFGLSTHLLVSSVSYWKFASARQVESEQEESVSA